MPQQMTQKSKHEPLVRDYQPATTLGAWGATQTGLREAKRLNLELVITMDADGNNEASDIKRLLQKMRGGGADAVIGRHGPRVKTSIPSRAMLRATSGLSYRDPTSGFRVLGSDAIGLLSSSAANFLDYQDVGVLLMWTTLACT